MHYLWLGFNETLASIIAKWNLIAASRGHSLSRLHPIAVNEWEETTAGERWGETCLGNIPATDVEPLFCWWLSIWLPCPWMCVWNMKVSGWAERGCSSATVVQSVWAPVAASVIPLRCPWTKLRVLCSSGGKKSCSDGEKLFCFGKQQM